ncbi:MAG: choice-of-anchor D domain-containing protein [Acidobacteriota bacterium]
MSRFFSLPLVATLLLASPAVCHEMILVSIGEGVLIPIVQPDIHLETSDPEIDFGTVAVEQSGERQLVLSNVSSDVQIVQLESSSAAVAVSEEVVTLDAGAEQEVTVTFLPTTVGPLSAEALVVVATDSEGYSQTIEVELTGEAIDAFLAVSSSDLEIIGGVADWGEVFSGANLQKAIDVKNTSDHSLYLSVDWHGDSGEVLITRTGDGLLDPGEVETLDLQYFPQSVAEVLGGSLVFSGADSTGAVLDELAIEQTSTLVLGYILPSAQSLDFGSVEVGTSGQQTLEVVSGSAGPVIVTAVVDASESLELPAEDEQFVLPATSAAHVIEVAWSPDPAADVPLTTLLLEATNEDGYVQAISIDLEGERIEPGAELLAYSLLASPSVPLGTIDFGTVVGGDTFTHGSFWIHNVSDSALENGNFLYDGAPVNLSGCPTADLCFEYFDSVWRPLSGFSLMPGERVLARALWSPSSGGNDLGGVAQFSGGAEVLAVLVSGSVVSPEEAPVLLLDAETAGRPVLNDVFFTSSQRQGDETVVRRMVLKNLGTAEVAAGDLLNLAPDAPCLPDGFLNKCFYDALGGPVRSYQLDPAEELEILLVWTYRTDEYGVSDMKSVAFTNGGAHQATLHVHTDVEHAEGGVDIVPTSANGAVAYPDEFHGARGLFNTNSFFSDLTIDAINRLNGNLVVTIPVGQTWQVGPNFTYGLSLIHNSNKWQVRSKSELDNTSGDDYSVAPITVPFPTNAGLGWNLSLGGELYIGRNTLLSDGQNHDDLWDWPVREINTKWLYVDRSGGRHPFGGHPSDKADGSARFSRNGSHIRLRDATGPNGQEVIYVDHPNGLSEEFARYSGVAQGCPASAGERCWRLKRIVDPFGNNVELAYASGGMQTTITDSHSRTMVVRYRAFQPSTANPYQTSVRKLVDEVEFTDANGAPAVWKLSIGEEHLTRACPLRAQSFSGPHNLVQEIPFLYRLDLPGADSVTGYYQFGYKQEYTPNLEGCENYNGALTKIKTPAGGGLEYSYGGVYLPIECPDGDDISEPDTVVNFGVYRRKVMTADPNAAPKSEQAFRYNLVDRSTGNGCNRSHTMETHVVHIETRPDPESPDLDGPDPDGPEKHFRHEVDYHTVTKTEYPDSLPSNGTWRVRDYGLPITKRNDLSKSSVFSSPSEKLFLSSLVYDCNDESTLVDVNDTNVCTLHRKVYRSFAYNTFADCWQPGVVGAAACRTLKNPLRAFREEHGGRWKEVRYTDYDGFGHFRTATTKSNFGGTATSTLQTSEYLGHYVRHSDGSEHGTEIVHHSVDLGGNMTLGPLRDHRQVKPWRLDLFDTKKSTRNGGTWRVDYDFDASGFLTCRRTGRRLNGTLDAKDVVARYLDDDNGDGEHDANGDGWPNWEEYSGGDYGVANCASANPEYRVYSTHEMGQTATSVFKHPGGPRSANAANVAPLSVDNTMNPHTGLVERSCDRTVHPKYCEQTSYDKVNRVVVQAPANNSSGRGSRRNLVYQVIGEGGGKVTTETRDTTDGNRLVDRTLVTLNEFGQEKRVEKWVSPERADYRVASAAEHVIRQSKLYHPNDQLNSVTGVYDRALWDQMDGNNGPNDDENWRARTRYRFQEYDIFGRLLRFRNPKGDWVEFNYGGGRSDYLVRLTPYEPDAIQQESTFDHLGRIVSFKESLRGNDELFRATDYTYSAGVETVSRTDEPEGGDSVEQQRKRTLDGRGYLVSEDLPEVEGQTQYKYDSLGNLRKTDYPGGYSVRNEYDAAGRLVRIKNAASRTLVQNEYHPLGEGGRLASATRFNYFTGPGTGFYSDAQQGPLEGQGVNLLYEVTDSYEYDDRGNVSLKRVSIDKVQLDNWFEELAGGRSTMYTADATWVFDGLGRVVQVNYPSYGGFEGFRDLSLRHSYSWGELVKTEMTETPGDGSSWNDLLTYTYYPNGILRQRNRYNLSGSPVAYDTRQLEVHEDSRPNSVLYPELHLPRIRSVGMYHWTTSEVWDSGLMQYDKRGNIQFIGQTRYDYDLAGRLSTVSLGGSTPPNYTYEYDAFDNLLQGDTSSFPITELDRHTNRVSKVGTWEIDYSLRGLLERIGSTHLRYDEFGKHNAWWWRYPSMEVGDYLYQAMYIFDADGNRVGVFNRLPVRSDPLTSTDPGGIILSAGEVSDLRDDFSEALVTFHSPGGTPMQEFRLTDQYNPVDGAIPGAFGLRSYVGREVVLYQGSDGVRNHPYTLRHLASDHLGSVRALLDYDESGQVPDVVGPIHYTPWGIQQGDMPESLGYAGHVTDRNHYNYELPRDGNGITTFMKARTYLPQIGRFLSVDPARSNGAWSLFAYAANDPINMVDPSGLAEEEADKTGNASVDVTGAKRSSQKSEGQARSYTERQLENLRKAGVETSGVSRAPSEPVGDSSSESSEDSDSGATISARNDTFVGEALYSFVQYTGLDEPVGPGGDKTRGEFAVHVVLSQFTTVGLTGPNIVKGAFFAPSIGSGKNYGLFAEGVGYTGAKQAQANVGLALKGLSGLPLRIYSGGKFTFGEALHFFFGRTAAVGVAKEVSDRTIGE